MPNIKLNPAGAGTGNGANNAKPYNNESYNTFNKSNMRLYTQRFDEVKPNFCQRCNDGDVVRIQSSHDLRTFTLKSPLMNGLQMKQEFFSVPFKAIMPHSWEYLERQPITGDDVPADMYPSFSICSVIKGVVSYLTDYYYRPLAWSAGKISLKLLRVLLLLGPDSLLENLGLNCDVYSVKFKDRIDKLFEATFDFVSIYCVYIDPVNQSVRFEPQYNNPDWRSQNLNAFYNWLNGIWDIQPLDVEDPFPSDEWEDIFVGSSSFDLIDQIYVAPDDYFSSPKVDFSPLVAYQMACSQFYSNSFVDQVYDGKQFYELMENLAVQSLALSRGVSGVYVNLNGKAVQYDFISNAALTSILGTLDASWQGFVFVDFLANLFAYRLSLRNDDYFTTARLRPLAVGGTDIDVTSSKVSVVDVNKQLWVQRFLQAVNRSQQQIDLYKENIFGAGNGVHEPQPVKLYSITYDLNGQEIEQTSASTADSPQGNIVTLMRSDSSSRVPEVYCDSNCWIIGVTKFYTPLPVYTGALHRQFMLNDRNDWFNPFLQHIGDQPVTKAELNSVLPVSSSSAGSQVFGYQLRYSQWKTAFSLANGAFKYGGLPSWFMSAYSDKFYVDPVLESFFIRNSNVMIDPLYLSLTGLTREDYFHFIIRFMHVVTVNSKQQAFPTLDV